MKSVVICFYLTFFFGFSNAQLSKPDSNFFPIAVWLQSTKNAEAYKDLGVNMYVGLYRSLDSMQLLDLRRAGLKVMCSQDSFSLKYKSDNIIYGWTQEDEPDNAQWNSNTKQYDPCIDPKIIISRYLKIKQKDPTRPVYLNLGQGVSYTGWVGRGSCTNKTDLYKSANFGYLSGCDIASFDIYPVNSNDNLISGNLWYVAKVIDSLKAWSQFKKPVWTWIETTLIGKDSPRKPTPAEVKSEVWMAIIHGAKGIGYFCHSWNPYFADAAILRDEEMMKGVKEINRQVTALGSILNSADSKNFAKVKAVNSAVPIDMLTKKVGNTHYIFAIGMRQESTKAIFTVKSGDVADVLGENRKIKIKNKTFNDSFDSCGVHLYRIISR